MTVDVSKINAGDQVTARFCSDYPGHNAPGVPYTITSELHQPLGAAPASKTLLMAEGECLRNSTGAPGSNLVEIVEHIPAEPKWTTWPLIKVGDDYLLRVQSPDGEPASWLFLNKSGAWTGRAGVEGMSRQFGPIMEAELRVVPKP